VSDRAVVWDLETGDVAALEPLPGGTSSVANAASRDGRVVVGQADTGDGRSSAVIWTDGGPPEWLTEGAALAVSADGSVVTGYTTAFGREEAFRWTRSQGSISLGELDGAPAREGLAMNADGTAIAGKLYTSEPDVYRPIRWTEAGGLELLGVAEATDEGRASAISADGEVVFGLRSEGAAAHIFRWTSTTGVQPLLPARDTYESAPFSSASGDVVVGRSYGQSFFWDARTSQHALVTDRLGAIVPWDWDWDLAMATGVADDGRTIVGLGVSSAYPQGGAWVAVLGRECGPPLPVAVRDSPEPAVLNAGLECGAVPGSACCAAPSEPCGAGLVCEEGACVQCAAFTPLGFVPGHLDVSVGAVSGDGRVVIGVGWPADGTSRAVRWRLDTGVAELLSPDPYVEPLAVNHSGSVVVGLAQVSDVRMDAFVWTETDGIAILAPEAVATGVSADGSVVVGIRLVLGGTQAFRWTAEDGAVDLERGQAPFSEAMGVSADGSVTVGRLQDGDGNGPVAIWSGNGLRILEPSSAGLGRGTGVNADGSVVVGMRQGAGVASVFRWTEATGMVDLSIGVPGALPATTRSGATVAATLRSRAHVWRSDTGVVKPVHGVLQGIVPDGWVLPEAHGISADGRTVIGRGPNPRGQSQGWAAVLGPHCTAPEP